MNDWGRGDGKFLSEEEKRTQSTTSVVSLCFFLPFLVLSVRAGTSIEQQRDRYRMEPHFLLSYITCLAFACFPPNTHSLTPLMGNRYVLTSSSPLSYSPSPVILLLPYSQKSLLILLKSAHSPAKIPLTPSARLLPPSLLFHSSHPGRWSPDP